MAKIFKVRDVDFRPGDVIVTKNGALFDLAGHTTIFIDSKRVVNITGYGDHSHRANIRDVVEDSIKDGWVKLYRANNYNQGAKAAIYGDRHFEDIRLPFFIDTNLNSTDVTYCSKMVLQSYCFGNGKNKIGNYGIVEPFRVIEVLEKEGFDMDFVGYLEP